MAETPKKGEKKAELKDLDLATGIDRVPEMWNRHGNTVLIIVTIAALAYAAWNWRARSVEQARLVAQQNLVTGREALSRLQAINPSNGGPEAYANYRRKLYEDGSAAVSDILGKSDDKTYLAQALILQGDLAYAVALMPEGAAAATRPALRLAENLEALLKKAKDSYQAVVQQYNTEKNETIAAHLGLAAIAENAGDFTVAKTQYEFVSADETAFATYRDFAKEKIRQIPDLERPLRFRASTMPATSMPATTRP